jgi:predicted RNA-binding Zn-ribbon protein involved in translation (DUF1610 family)
MSNYNFITVQVKCPHCGKSLMDHDHKVDNEPGIHLLVKTPSKTGMIWLSSIYGSYNFFTNAEMDDTDVAVFSCPFCKEEITSKERCGTCDAPMSTLILDIGGKINFCTRKGCKNHNIGFEDFSTALTKFYQDFDYHGKGTDTTHAQHHDKAEKTASEENKEIIESGAFLQSYCPHCKKSLIENDMLKLKIVNENKESGYIMLSPYLNVFSSKSTIFLPEDKKLDDIMCPHCEKSLMIPDGKCERCGTQIAKILVGARTKMIDFFVCSKKGCTWHGLSKDDLSDIRLEDSLEW